jgi:hypothetical protein
MKIYCLTLGKITVYVTTAYEQSRIGILLVEGITSVDEIFDTQILVTREKIDGTKKYRIFTNANNLPQYQLISDQTYDANIIVVRPLF